MEDSHEECLKHGEMGHNFEGIGGGTPLHSPTRCRRGNEIG